MTVRVGYVKYAIRGFQKKRQRCWNVNIVRVIYAEHA
jgi:hypothetical protein